ncbi:MAG: FHA domain-containing protein [Planctomycetota bacterium]|jgi:hypothetical protein|nr:FHA domain-containing protein [Planctomycetota bacterium]
MANYVKPLRYLVEVTTGKSAGKFVYLEDKPVLVGSSPMAALSLTDDGVKAEHALVSREGEQIWLENLSSGGTLLNGRTLTKRAMLMPDDVFTVADDVELTLRSTAEKGGGSGLTWFLVALIFVVLAGAGLAAAVAAKKTGGWQRRAATQDWHGAFMQLETRLHQWRQKNIVPAELEQDFREAWFRDCGGDSANALFLWQKVKLELLNGKFPGILTGNETVGAAAFNREASLRGLLADADSVDEIATRNDRSYLTALWWFVDQRLAELTKPKK